MTLLRQQCGWTGFIVGWKRDVFVIRTVSTRSLPWFFSTEQGAGRREAPISFDRLNGIRLPRSFLRKRNPPFSPTISFADRLRIRRRRVKLKPISPRSTYYFYAKYIRQVKSNGCKFRSIKEKFRGIPRYSSSYPRYSRRYSLRKGKKQNEA